MAGPTDNKDTSNSGNIGLSTKELIAAIGALLVLLLLVQYYPRVIIGFMLLILVGVVLTHSNTVSNLFNSI